MAKPKTPKPVTDLAIVGGPTPDGQGAQLLRVRDGVLSAGEIRPAREGQPITGGELVRLRPLDSDRRVCAVEVLHAPADASSEPAEQPPQSPGTRRARVATDRYRKNWDTVFEPKPLRVREREPRVAKRTKTDWALN